MFFVTFFEKKVTPKNFTAGKVFGLHRTLDHTPSCHPERNEVKSNPEGVCKAQDLRGDSRILFEIPTLRVALRVRLAIKLLAQDDTQNINSANYENINFAFCILNFAFIKSPSLKVFER